MEHRSQQTNTILTEAAEALFQFGRLFGKTGIRAFGSSTHAVELSRILIVQAVESMQSRAEQEITVGAIAQQLVVEPSTASRLVADAIKDGYLSRRVSPTDSRRVQIDLTDTGRTLAQDARAYQIATFRQATRDWTDQERAEFARLFIKFTEAVSESVQANTANNREQP